MLGFLKSKTFIFVVGLMAGLLIFLWISNTPCYNTADISSYFFQKFQPCNARTLSRVTERTAELALVPAETTVRVGQSFSVSLIMEPEGLDVNAVGVRITNSTNTKVVSNDESMSPFSIHLTEPFAPVDFNRVVQVAPNPGVTSASVMAKFYFTALASGIATIMINSSSLVLANDGFGTDVLGYINNATVKITP